VFARVVETIMIFALGFLAATLIALLIIPAINARAERLARRRTEALLPMSISELTAEKDLLRAEFAVLQRRMERKAAKAMSVKHASMEELGRRALRIDALEAELSDRDGAMAALRAELSDVQARLSTTEAELAAANAALSGTRETLAAIEDAHRKTLDELANSRSELDRVKTAMSASKAELALVQEKLQAEELARIDLETRHNQALSELDTKRITISDLETRLATQTARGHDFERALSERRGELSEERQRLADFAKDLLAEQERGLLLDQRIRELEKDRDAKAADVAKLAAQVDELSRERDALKASLEAQTASAAAIQKELDEARRRGMPVPTGEVESGSDHAQEINSLSERVELLRAEKASLEGALSVARQERTRLDEELAALHRRTDANSEAIRAENAELRQRIVEVADEIMQAASQRKADRKDRSVSH
jgi:chromosome segregation ATPase